jgi:4-hydroxy-3-polyprenylbenzoate decarboxylase
MPGQVRDIHKQLASEGVLEGIDWVVYIDHYATGLGWGDIVWLVANNIDPLRDCFHAPGHPSLAIDGTMKTRLLDDFDRDWPNVITMSEEVIREIDNRWDSLGLGEFIKSPSLKYQSLIQGKGAVAKQ